MQWMLKKNKHPIKKNKTMCFKWFQSRIRIFPYVYQQFYEIFTNDFEFLDRKMKRNRAMKAFRGFGYLNETMLYMDEAGSHIHWYLGHFLVQDLIMQSMSFFDLQLYYINGGFWLRNSGQFLANILNKSNH